MCYSSLRRRKQLPVQCNRGSRQSWALIEARCSNQMRVAQGQVLVVGFVPLCLLLHYLSATFIRSCRPSKNIKFYTFTLDVIEYIVSYFLLMSCSYNFTEVPFLQLVMMYCLSTVENFRLMIHLIVHSCGNILQMMGHIKLPHTSM